LEIRRLALAASWVIGVLFATAASRVEVAQKPENARAGGAESSQDEVRFVGCLVKVNKDWPGTQGSEKRRTATGSSGFVLKDASPAEARNPRSEREIGLRGQGVDLGKQVGHEVEVTGRMATEPGSRSGGNSGDASKASPSTGTAPQSRGNNTGGSILEVTGVRVVNAACPMR